MMLKRFLIVGLTFLAAVAGLFIYQWFTASSQTGSAASDAPPPPPPSLSDAGTGGHGEQIVEFEGVRIEQTRDPCFVTRDRDANITQKFGWREVISKEDEALVVAAPHYSRYLTNGKMICINAETGQVQTPGVRQGEIPQRGSLHGVTVTMYPTHDRREPAEMEVRLAGRVEFEVEFSRLDCPGGFEVQSQDFQAAGEGLRLQYDQIDERVQEMTIRQLDRLRFARNTVSDRQLSPGAGSAKTEPQAGAVEDGSADADAEAEGKGKRATYRLTLSDDVAIALTDEETLLADKVEVLADVDYAGVSGSDAAGDEGAGQAGEAVASDGAASEDGAQTSADREFVEISCAGLVRIDLAKPESRLVDDVPVGERGERFEFLATGTPVEVIQGGEVAQQANVIYLNRAAELIRLASTDDELPVVLALDADQRAIAQRQVELRKEVTASGEPGRFRATLSGPGQISLLPEPNRPTRIDYEDAIEICFAERVEAVDAEAKLLRKKALGDLVSGDTEEGGGFGDILSKYDPESITFTNGLVLTDPNTDLQARDGRITFFAPKSVAEAAGGQDAGAEDSGSVRIKSLELTDCNAVLEETVVRAGRLKSTFGLDREGRAYPEHLTGREDVYLETAEFVLDAKDRLEAAFAAADPERPSQVGAEREGQAGAAEAEDGKSSTAKGLSFDPNMLLWALAEGADDGVSITDKSNGYRVAGSLATYGEAPGTEVGAALRRHGVEEDAGRLWVIQGEPARVAAMEPNAMFEELVSEEIIAADLGAQRVHIPGVGALTAYLREDPRGAALAEPMPAAISWQGGAVYDLGTGEITVNDVVMKFETETAGSRYENMLKSRQVVILLAEAAGPEGADGASQQERRGRLVDFRAEGPEVQLARKEYALADDSLVSASQLRASKLTYDPAVQELVAGGPGWMELVSYPGGDTSRGEGDDAEERSVAGRLRDMGPTISVVQFESPLRMAPAGSAEASAGASQYTLVSEGSVTVRQFPLLDPNSVTVETLAETAGFKQLLCEALTLTLEPGAEEAEADALGVSGLRALEASGGVFGEVVGASERETFSFSGASVRYEAGSGWLTIEGGEGLGVTFNQVQCGAARANLRTREVDIREIGPSVAPGL